MGRNPHGPYAAHEPRSAPEDRLHVRTAKQAICAPLNEVEAQPLGSPQTEVAVVHVPHEVPGPSEPHAATVFGMPLFGSSRTASPMSLVSEMIPMRTPARAAPDASIDCQNARPTSTVSITKAIKAGVMRANSTRAWAFWPARRRRESRQPLLTGPGSPSRCSAVPDPGHRCS